MGRIRVGVNGATGRMGRLVVAEVLGAEDLELVAAVTRPGSAPVGLDAGTLVGLGPAGIALTDAPRSLADADVVIDFSLPEALEALLQVVGSAAVVTGTTGLDASTRRALDRHAQGAPVLHAANFSTGVAVLTHLVRQAARVLAEADVEIVEAHHRHKVDAPSGTALHLGRAVAAARGLQLADVADHGRHGRTGVREDGRIGFHALRLGDVVGEHSVWFGADGERIALSHSATSRSTFAAGAVRAARWLAGRPAGSYTFEQALGIGD